MLPAILLITCQGLQLSNDSHPRKDRALRPPSRIRVSTVISIDFSGTYPIVMDRKILLKLKCAVIPLNLFFFHFLMLYSRSL